jgi:DNA-directed RNA polymerase subunit RPC12/RpoP
VKAPRAKQHAEKPKLQISNSIEAGGVKLVAHVHSWALLWIFTLGAFLNRLLAWSPSPAPLLSRHTRMDIVFKCEHCEQELSVDDSAVGVEIQCPSCNNSLVVPAPPPGAAPPAPTPVEVLNPMATSAAAREERHFKVPTYDKAPVPSIEKPLKPLEAAAKDTGKGMRVKTLRHSDHIEVGKDLFDEHVSQFLQKVGETNIISISPINYTHMDLATRQWVTDYGLMIVYRG